MIGWSLTTNAYEAVRNALWQELQRHGIEHPGDTVLTDAAMVALDPGMTLELRVNPYTGMHTLEAWRVRAGRYRDTLRRHHWQRGERWGVQEGYVTIGTIPSTTTRDAGRRSVVWHYALRKVGDARG